MCLSCLAFSDCLEMGVVQRSAVPILLFLFFPSCHSAPCLTFQPFEFIPVTGPKGTQLVFWRNGENEIIVLKWLFGSPRPGLPHGYSLRKKNGGDVAKTVLSLDCLHLTAKRLLNYS